MSDSRLAEINRQMLALTGLPVKYVVSAEGTTMVDSMGDVEQIALHALANAMKCGDHKMVVKAAAIALGHARACLAAQQRATEMKLAVAELNRKG